jgi:DNA repair protein RecN (Recombination protein N)
MATRAPSPTGSTKACANLDALIRLDARLAPVGELLECRADPGPGSQRRAARLRPGDLDLDPEHLARVEQRLAAAHQLAASIEWRRGIAGIAARFEAELDALEHSETRLEDLQQAVKTARAAISNGPTN